MKKKALRDTLVRWVWRTETRVDGVVRAVRNRLDPIEEVRLQAYRGYGNGQRIHLRARVMEHRKLRQLHRESSTLDNVRVMLKQIATREIPKVPVRAEVDGEQIRTITDEEGYAQFEIKRAEETALASPWQPAHLSVPANARAPTAKCSTEVLIPPASARFAVVSDVDDTIIKTGATSVLKKTRLTLFRNAHSRVPFEGAAAFYASLQSGVGEAEFNPLFYLSSSPWNLYDLLTEFMEVHGFPRGPLLLKDLGIQETHLFKSPHDKHKLEYIESLMADYPRLPFILIGDSGQHDAEIYRQVVRDFPDRVAAIYIRDVTRAERARQMRDIIAEIQGQGVEMLLVRDTLEAARHAIERGWIRADALQTVRRERDTDHDEDGNS